MDDRDRMELMKFVELKSLSTAPNTVRNVWTAIKGLSKFIPLSDITPDNTDEVRSAIISFFAKNHLAPSTRLLYFNRIKEFVAWRLGEYGEDYAPLTMQVFKGIKIRAPKSEPVSKEDVVLYEEWEECMRAVDTWRDKFILAALFEGGFRRGELISTNVGDWHLHDGYVECHIRKGKTGPRTTPPMAVASGLMKMYLEHEHPDPENPDAPMFVSKAHHATYRGKRMGRNGMERLMKMLNYRLGGRLKKHLHTHMFRKGCCSYLYLQGVDDLVIRQWLGWTPTSTEPQKVYRWVDREREKRRFLVSMGIIHEEDRGDELPRHRTCPVCGTANTASALFCTQCGTALSYEAVRQKQQVEAEAMEALLSLTPEEQATLRELLHSEQLRQMLEGGGEPHPPLRKR
ncbi:MAG: tyrosine-type recombinase/integrase [Methermicoccaceae archaeon]